MDNRSQFRIISEAQLSTENSCAEIFVKIIQKCEDHPIFSDFRDFDPNWFQKHPSRTGKLGAGTRRPYDCRKTERGRNTTTIRALHF